MKFSIVQVGFGKTDWGNLETNDHRIHEVTEIWYIGLTLTPGVSCQGIVATLRVMSCWEGSGDNDDNPP